MNPRRRRHTAGRLLLASILLVTLLTLCYCSGDSGNGKIKASGTIEATEINVASKAAGEVMKLFVEEGDQVSLDDTISLIDTTVYAMQLRQAEAAVDLADAQHRLVINGARSEDVRSVEETLTQAEAAMNVARDDADRMKKLYESQSVTKKQLDDADARYTVALAQFRAAEQALQKVRKIARSEDVQSAEARLRQAEAARDILRNALSNCAILSPTKGVITNRPIETGELAGMGSVIVTVSKLDTIDLTIYVNEIELADVRLGQTAQVTIDAFADRSFEGHVVYISPVAEFTPKNVQTEDERTKLVFGVKIEVPNPDGVLKPGMPADAAIQTNGYALH